MLFLIRLRPATLLKMKKKTLPQVLSSKFMKFSTATFLQNTSGRLVLAITLKSGI